MDDAKERRSMPLRFRLFSIVGVVNGFVSVALVVCAALQRFNNPNPRLPIWQYIVMWAGVLAIAAAGFSMPYLARRRVDNCTRPRSED